MDNSGQNYWQCGRFQIDLAQPKIMGIVNLTPDSFSDGGSYSTALTLALKHAEQLLKDGADILDIGGESSRPGSNFVSPQDEWKRIELVLRELVTWNVPLTVDTRRTWVMRQLLEQQLADGINDIQALEDTGAVDLLAQQQNIGVCLMHMQGQPENMQHNPEYQDVVTEVGQYLQQRVSVCNQAGIERSRLTIDPGFGFGKSLQHNIALMQHFADWHAAAGCPVLIGVSRKTMIGLLTDETEPRQRVVGSVVAAVAAVARGAAIIRVHDVRETCQGLQVWAALGGSI
ncbi:MULTISPECIES: dihydropteroate synthase [unclassified Snodgrassella]|uniref:dihydropteroate synthase n=1 Tax=unclassified Snodgrassella TaxID=2625236 RepID=UPI0018DEC9A7|nr:MULTISPECIES: dihydropteroate synthase [unclassified Snodgrassella]MBI0067017.1 dihydropteroate synthase [Snodgrassella sp. M0110]MBI0076064.1 dihydropteroate synthase [Snodgrassella sp. M0118]MBI0078318.1 dihydropteroate synthase [Snodgrassella sp. M0112]